MIQITLFIYSCVRNLTQEMTSERHQTDYDLDLIIIKTALKTTAGVTRWLTRPVEHIGHVVRMSVSGYRC